MTFHEDDDKWEEGNPQLRVGPTLRDWRRVDLEFFRGDTIQFPVQVKLVAANLRVPCDPPPKPAVQDITSWLGFWATGKNTVVDPDALAVFQVTKTSAPPGVITVTEATNGLLLVTINPISTYMQPDSLVQLAYDVQGKDAASAIHTVQYGRIRIVPDVTRAIA